MWAYDGSTWEQLYLDGFGNPNNIATVPVVVHENELWFGAEVWRLRNGVWSLVSSSSYGASLRRSVSRTG